MDHLINIQEFNGKYKINENYRPIAEALKAKYDELKYVPVNSILFIEGPISLFPAESGLKLVK